MINEKTAPALNIKDLCVAYQQEGEWWEAVHEVSLQIQPGEIYGLVGESGSGKTTLALAVLRYLGKNGMIRQGKIELSGVDLVQLQPAEMRKLWGHQMALIPQNPQSSLNPAMRVGDQIAEVYRHTQDMETGEARHKAVEMLREVNIPDPGRVTLSYPHQLSGGMQQRVLIAMALISNPSLLILDEPTTNLDVTTQATILDLLRSLIEQRQTAALYITHNLAVVAQMCRRAGVLYAGRLVEEAFINELFARPLHPYTQGLLESMPRLGDHKDSVRLRAIEGRAPVFGDIPSGCVFRPRCPIANEICETNPPLSVLPEGRKVRCHRWEVSLNEAGRSHLPDGRSDRNTTEKHQLQPLLSLEGVSVHYPLKRSLREVVRREPKRAVRAVEGMDLKILSGQTLGLVGESGSGKSTLARATLGVVDKTAGTIELLGIQLPDKLSRRTLDTLRKVQSVFQNPEEALNPYLTVGEILQRPMMTLLGWSRQEAIGRVPDLLRAVRLPAMYAERLPTQLSGGEKQRVAIARASAAKPNLLICDEPVSALDVSVQASILNLLEDLQAEHGNSLLFISHDMAVVGFLADTIAVIYLGELVEIAETGDLFKSPYHPYTEALLSAIPGTKVESRRVAAPLVGEIPSPIEKPGGCPFHSRCPRLVGEICKRQPPPWQSQQGSSKRYLCHIPWEELQAQQGDIQGFEISRG